MTATIQETAVTPETQAPVNIFDRAMCLKLDMGLIGSAKKVGTDKVEVDADKSRINVSKRILDSKELEAIAAEQRAVGKRIRRLCLPSMFKAGIYLIPNASLSEIDGYLVEAEAKIMNVLVPAFLAVYPDLVEADKLSLRGTYNPADYPPIAKVRASISFRWNYFSFGVPPELEAVDSDIAIREQRKAAARITEAADEIQQILRAQMLDLVNHMAERLDGGRAGGKPKIFKNSLVENVKEFIQTFQARNITDDKELDALCMRAKGLLDGVDPESLRDSEQTRVKVAEGFKDIKATLDTMMVARPSRGITFELDE